MDLVEIGIATALVSLLVYVGLFFACAACKWQKVLKLGFIFDPLVKLCKLPRCCSFYFLMCLVNLSSSLPTLSGFYKKGLVSNDKQVIAAVLTAGLPIMLWYVVFLTGPLVIGLFGVKNGIYFLVVWTSIGLVQTAIGVTYSRIKLSEPAQEQDCEYGGYSYEGGDFKTKITDAFKESLKMAVKVLRILAPVIFILYVITNSEEVMSYVTAGLQPIASIFPLDSEEALLISLTAAVNLIPALSITPQFIVDGLPLIEAFMAIIVGMFMFNLFDVFHSFIPFNVAFFGRKLGMKVAIALFLSIGISDLAVIMMLWAVKIIA